MMMSADGAEAADNSSIQVSTDVEVEGMEPSPLMQYQFDLGTRSGSAGDPFVTVTNQTYSEETGYGYISNVNDINYEKHDSAPIASGESEYDLALQRAVSDAARAGEMEFAIDLPAGEYMINVYSFDSWNGASDGATFYVNDVLIGTYSYTKDESRTVDECAMSARVVLPEDGQIVVKGVKGKDNGLAYINAITVNEYVISIPDYNETAWDVLTNAMASLKVKTAQYTAESTPADYDAVLVNKMTAVLDAAADVNHMPLLDTTAGDAAYALAEEAVANRPLYSEASMALLEAAMANYQAVLGDMDVQSDLEHLVSTLNYWLQGVDMENVPEAYSLYADFDTQQTKNGGYDPALAYETPGWTSIGLAEGYPYLTLYSEETGYGMLSAANGRHRGTGNTLIDDFMLGGTFLMDLPAGEYHVTVYTGELSGTGRSSYTFYTDYDAAAGSGNVIAASDGNVEAPTNGYTTSEYTFTLEEAAQVAMVASSYTNAVMVEQVVPVTVAGYDMTKLQELVASIDAAQPEEDTYTISSWTAFKTAYDDAVALIEEGSGYIQEATVVYNNLSAAF